MLNLERFFSTNLSPPPCEVLYPSTVFLVAPSVYQGSIWHAIVGDEACFHLLRLQNLRAVSHGGELGLQNVDVSHCSIYVMIYEVRCNIIIHNMI